MKEKTKKIIFISILVVVFLLMLLLNIETLMVSDDYAYQFIFTGREPTINTKLVANPLEIFTSMKNHWNLWGGRVTIHYLLQFVFMLGVNVFNIVNSIMFVLLGILIYKHINTKKNYNLLLIIIIYSMLFLFLPQPGSTIIWKSGSANYLWSSVFTLIMTLIYKRHYDFNNINDNTLNTILLFVFGLFVGCLNENTGCALIILEALFIIVYKKKYKKIPKWAISSLLGTIIGYTILVIAPGNYIRANLMYAKKEYTIDEIFKDFLIITRLTYVYIKEIILLTIISLVVIYNKKDEFKDIINKYLIQIMLLVFSFISIYSLVLSPAYPERCWFFAYIYLLIIFGINITKLELKKDYIKKIIVIFTITISLWSFSEYCDAYFTIDSSYIELNAQLKEIKKQVAAGKLDIEVHEVFNHEGKYNAFTENGYLNSNKDSWFNKWFAKYYGINSITSSDWGEY